MTLKLKESLLCAVLALSATSSAFEVNFWLGPQCTDEGLGTYTSSDPSNAPCNVVPENAESATVEKQSQDGSDDNVEFYSSTNCDSSTGVASTDAGCIDFTGEMKNARSWQVQNDLSNPGRKKLRIRGREVTGEPKRELSGPWWTSKQEEMRSALHISEQEATGSLSPDWDPTAHVEAGFGHGNVTARWGRTWKWQQVALGASIGIPVADWDDAVHTKSDRFIAFGDVEYESQLLSRRSCGADTYPAAKSDVLTKRWNYGQCRAILDCSRQAVSAATGNLGNGWAQACRAGYKLKTYGSTFYDFAHAHPFSVSIVLGTGTTAAGYGLGYTHGGATAQDNDQLGNCSGDSTQVNSFIQSLVDAAGASGKSAAQTDITLDDGHILAISAEVYPKGQAPPTTQCDADGKSGA
ncbi:hypothetical protein DOTSEDRAFT_31474 [Dothistroma septosporum NZE10]|uniref:Ecp2 effector protein domain-containing protein n=1 Tax=Dothistroma septosporum (strain NZE10 / CBS 128990) TaxID=675120 RepID=N1Q5E8_DOTSN|nr:hypothetical protein DOTSEDRAFT_31474 [Dothistroma septosporum NZE10]